MYVETFMRRAIELSKEALTRPGTEPFGAVVVKGGAIVGEGLNHSRAHFDPTSHGEVEAIRDACRRLECVDLSACDLYTSCEPCAMCVATMEIAGIAKLYYAASMQQSRLAFAGLATEQRRPIDTERVRSEAGAPVSARLMPSEQHMDREAVGILETWAHARRTL